MAGSMAITLGMVSLSVMGLTCAGAEQQPRSQAFGVSISTDKGTYQGGEAILMTLCAFSRTGEEVTLHFISAKRHDFAIEDDQGKEVWRWSEGRVFAQMLGEEKLGSGRAEIAYTARYEGKLDPGTYKITGTVTGRSRPMSASLTVEVR